jgi:hypothetical protein
MLLASTQAKESKTQPWTRDVNLIFSFLDVYAVKSNLIDQPVCNLAKKDGFAY